MIDIREQVEELTAEGAVRPAGTEEEHNAALMIEERYEMLGLETSVEEFSCPNSLPVTSLAAGILTFLGGLLLFFAPKAAIVWFIFGLIALVLIILKALGIFSLDNLLSPGISQNVIGRYEPNTYSMDDGRSPRKVVIVAHYDTARPEPFGKGIFVKNHAAFNWIGLGVIILMVVCALASIFTLPAIVTKVLGILALVCAVISLILVVLTVLGRTGGFSDGANDNASGTAVMLSIADTVMDCAGVEERPTRRSRENSDADVNGAASNMGIPLDEAGRPDWRGRGRVRRRGDGEDAAAAVSMDATDEVSSAETNGAIRSGRVTRRAVVDDSIDNTAVEAAVAGESLITNNGPRLVDNGGATPYAVQNMDVRVTARPSAQQLAEEQAAREAFAQQTAAAAAREAAMAAQAPQEPVQYAQQTVASAPQESKPQGLPSWWTAGKSKATAPEGEALAAEDVQKSQFADLPSDTMTAMQALVAKAQGQKIEQVQQDEVTLQAAEPQAVELQQFQGAAAAAPAPQAEFQQEQGAVVETTGYSENFQQGSPEEMAAADAAVDDPAPQAAPAQAGEDLAARLEYLKNNPLASLRVEEPVEEAPAPVVIDDDLKAMLSDATQSDIDSYELEPKDEVASDVAAALDALEAIAANPLEAAPMSQAQSAQAAQVESEDAAPSLAALNDLPDLDAFTVRDDGFDMSASDASDFEGYYDDDDSLVSSTGSFQRLGATMAFGAVDDSAFENVNQEELYIQDADDSDFAPNGGEYLPSEPEMPKSRRSLLGRKRKGRRGEADEQSANEWLNLDNDFDARHAGADIGSWDNFEESDNWQEGDTWRGGAFGGASEEEDFEAIQETSTDLLNKEIWFVSLGASNLGHAGMKAFLKRHGNQLKDALIINVECVGAGDLCFIESEGYLSSKSTDERALMIGDAVVESLNMDIPFESLKWLTTDAYPANKQGIRSLTLMGLDSNNMPVAWHSKDDRTDIIEEETLQLAAEIVLEAAKFA